MAWRVGTSGFSYKEWKGSFYPEKLAAKDMLRYYAGQLPAVEINSTFYRLPRTDVLASWAEEVPPGFRFAIKASQRITHRKRLRDVAEPTTYLLDTVAVLGERLGALLFQLPPNMKLDLERFDAFLDLLPEGTRAAWEFRHPSWHDDEVHARLRARDFALCQADPGPEEAEEGGSAPPVEIVRTASWGYLRLRRVAYTDEHLDAWARAAAAQGWSEGFVFFKHEDGATGPALARRFLAEVEA